MRRCSLSALRPIALSTVPSLVLVLGGCSDESPRLPTSPAPPDAVAAAGPPDLGAALAAQRRHTPDLMARRGVVGTAVGVDERGTARVTVFTADAAVPGLPSLLDGVPVAVRPIGRVMARSDPTTRRRPAPLGFSVGHPDITAGTIGARVVDGLGRVFLLSNNHVLANMNNAQLDNSALQPGPIDGGTDPSDRIGGLFAFEPLHTGLGGYGVIPPANTIDAAIALSTRDALSNSTPTDDGYGIPSATIFADGNGDGFFDDRALLLLAPVQKYGRTTQLTQGQVTEVNVTIDVCYDIFCFSVGRFYDQIGICCTAFSDGGDSGSLIVSRDGTNRPLGLLFAGGDDRTFANRIDLVLDRFDVAIDASAPAPVTDLAVTAVTAPASATQGTTVPVGVTVQNVGNQAVTDPVGVTLRDQTAGTTIGSQSIASLAAGASTTLTFDWSTAGSALGPHTLAATQNLADATSANDSRSTTVTIEPTGDATMHVGDLDGARSNSGRTWVASITISVHNGSHGPVGGATVTGRFSAGAKGTGSCITDASGSCFITKSRLRGTSVTFTVTGVTHPSRTYQGTSNHDPDGGNGTVITVPRP